MRRMAFAVVALVGCCAPARAETLPLIEGAPATYTPGQNFTFTIRVPELPGLTSYTLELVFSADALNPPLIAFPTVAPPGSYVFPSSANFQLGLTLVPGSNEVRLALADSIAPPGVITTPGLNDTLATITVVPDPALTGPLTISLGNGTQFGYNMEIGTVAPPPVVIEQAAAPGGGTPVPAPAGVVLLGIGGLVFGLRARALRRVV